MCVAGSMEWCRDGGPAATAQCVQCAPALPAPAQRHCAPKPGPALALALCTRVQWASIPVLALGVILVTVNNGGGGGAKMSAAAAAGSSSSHGLDYVAGMVACSVTGLSSAYAGACVGRRWGGAGRDGRAGCMLQRAHARQHARHHPPAPCMLCARRLVLRLMLCLLRPRRRVL